MLLTEKNLVSTEGDFFQVLNWLFDTYLSDFVVYSEWEEITPCS